MLQRLGIMLLGRVERACAQQLAERDDRLERGAQLAPDGRDQLGLGPVGSLGRFARLALTVELVDKALDLSEQIVRPEVFRLHRDGPTSF